ncbi:HSP20-like chaperone [Crucibulum laeve]|uniref:HSP20-like chaperone n=1 Tax=Crucibulum laeve TaxID=68775 RepID=A0A5C3LU85_9AGAR|nr:HSP20-like chaperone [Crucibulum laeve]
MDSISLHYEPFYDFDRLFDEAFSRRSSNRGSAEYNQGNTGYNHLQPRPSTQHLDEAIRAFKPRMDLHEDTEKNLVTATFEFPGVRKEDVQLDVHNGRLVVSAENKLSEEHEERGYVVRERRFGRFLRTLQLPQGVQDGEIKASMEDGILTVTFPKSVQEQAPKKITIS